MEDKRLVIKEGTTTIKKEAYANGEFESVAFPTSLQIIGEKAFSYCSQVHCFILPEGIKQIDRGAFRGTKAIIFVPKTIQKIGEDAFSSEDIVYFECGPEDFEGYHESHYEDSGHPFSFYGYGGAGSWVFSYYYQSGCELHFNATRDDFLKALEENK